VYPNYQVIKNITTRVVTKENLIIEPIEGQGNGNGGPELEEKIEELLMKFIIFFKT
jgi:hypothetical protein